MTFVVNLLTMILLLLLTPSLDTFYIHRSFHKQWCICWSSNARILNHSYSYNGYFNDFLPHPSLTYCSGSLYSAVLSVERSSLSCFNLSLRNISFSFLSFSSQLILSFALENLSSHFLRVSFRVTIEVFPHLFSSYFLPSCSSSWSFLFGVVIP